MTPFFAELLVDKDRSDFMDQKYGMISHCLLNKLQKLFSKENLSRLFFLDINVYIFLEPHSKIYTLQWCVTFQWYSRL